MEPKWTPVPPQPSALPHLPLERIRGGALFRGLITSHSVLGVLTHFMGGRTLACVDGNCPGCEAQMPQRWEGYLAVITPQPTRHIIVALTPGAALGIADSAPDAMMLRGNLLICERSGKRANARLRARIEPTEPYGKVLPPAPDLKAHLLHIWGLDTSHAAMDHPAYANRVKEFFTNPAKPSDESPS